MMTAMQFAHMCDIFELNVPEVFISKLEKQGYDKHVLWQIWNKVDADVPYDKRFNINTEYASRHDVKTFIDEVAKLGGEHNDEQTLSQTWDNAYMEILEPPTAPPTPPTDLPAYLDDVFEFKLDRHRDMEAFINKLENHGYDKQVLWQIWNKVAIDATAPYNKWGDILEMGQVTHQNIQTFVGEIEKLGGYDKAILLQTWAETSLGTMTN
jgi:hypothetical protein